MTDLTSHPAENGPTESRPVSYRWLVFAILAAIYLLVYFHRQAPAVLSLDLMKDLGLNGTALGLISAAYFLPYAVMQAPAGLFTGVWGPRKLLCASLCLAGAGSLVLAFAPGFSTALVGRALVGLGVSTVLVCVLEIMARWFPQRTFVRMLGYLLGVGGLGVFVGAAPLAYLDSVVGWRSSFEIIAAMSFLLAAALWFLVRSTPDKMGFPMPDSHPMPAVRQAPGDFPKNLKSVAVSPGFWPPAIWGFMSVAIFSSLGCLWGGPYLMHTHGLSKLQTGHILAMLAVGMVIGGPLLAYLAGSVFGSRKRVLVATCLGLVMLMIVLILLAETMPIAALYAWFGLLGLVTMGAAPLALTLSRDSVQRSLTAPATGVCNFLFLVGGAIIQPVAGWILDAHGNGVDYTAAHYQQTFYLYLVLAIMALAAALAIKEPPGPKP